MRLISMEYLGFFEAPDRVWTSPANGHRSDHAASPDDSTGLIPLPTGRHSKHAVPTGELVKDIWDSTEFFAPDLTDWEPNGFGDKHMGRRFRWPMLLLLVVLLAVAGGVGYWLYRAQDDASRQSISQLRTEAETLEASLQQVEPLVANLDADRLPEANSDASVYFEMGEDARALFAASAELPDGDLTRRDAATDAAGLAIDASRHLMNVTAFRTALEPALAVPALESDADLIDLTTAAETFAAWRAGFESVVAALPADGAATTSAALVEVVSGLEAAQAAYLDAIRTDDRAAALATIGTLAANLQAVRQAMLSDIGQIEAEVSDLIDRSLAGVARLLD